MFLYQADTYCDTCGHAIRRRLEAKGYESSPDSDDWPIGAGEEGETDAPQHCASAGDCLEPIDLGDYGLPAGAEMIGAETRTIGALLSDNLTEHGAAYLAEMLGEEPRTPYQVALHRLWRETFADYLPDEQEPIREWAEEGFSLSLYDAGWQAHGDRRPRLRYVFKDAGKLIFQGDDYSPSPLHAIDSDEAVAGLLGFLSLRPGDTDPEYFERYTPAQLDWANARGEYLALLASDIEEAARDH